MYPWFSACDGCGMLYRKWPQTAPTGHMVRMVNIVLMAHGAYGAQSTYNAYPELVAIFATDHTPPLAHAQACERVDGLHGSLTPLLHVSHLRAKLRLGWGQGKG